MTTGDFFVWYKEIDSLEYFDSKGVWTKIIQFSPDKDLVAMSHWVSNSITVFDINTKTLIREIKTGKTPRGIVWFSDSIFAAAALSFLILLFLSFPWTKLTSIASLSSIIFYNQQLLI